MRARTFVGLCLPVLLIVLGGCNAPGGIVTEQPERMPADTIEPEMTATEVEASEEPGVTVTPPGPPTETPPTVAPAQALPTLMAGIDLEIALIHMIDRNVGWAIGGVDGSRDRVLHTVDGAETFRDVTPPVGGQLAGGVDLWATGAFLDAQIARILYYPAIQEPAPPGGASVVIWGTQDSGSGWTRSEVIETSVLGTQDFPPRLFFINADEGWFMARNGGAGMHRYPVSLYRTQDRAATWELLIEAIGGSELQSCRKTGWAFGDASVGIATIDNCPVDGPAIERTVDGGATWERVILPPPQEAPETVSSAYCETSSPQFVTEDWVLLSASCTSYDDPQVERQLLYRSPDGGQSWDGWDFPGGDVFFLDETRGFSLNREIHWTADGGVTWEREKTVHWDGQFSFVDADVGWAVARADDEVALVKTEDRGQSWQIIEPTLER